MLVFCIDSKQIGLNSFKWYWQSVSFFLMHMPSDVLIISYNLMLWPGLASCCDWVVTDVFTCHKLLGISLFNACVLIGVVPYLKKACHSAAKRNVIYYHGWRFYTNIGPYICHYYQTNVIAVIFVLQLSLENLESNEIFREEISERKSILIESKPRGFWV